MNEPINKGNAAAEDNCVDKLAAIQTIPQGRSPLISPKTKSRGYSGKAPAWLDTRSKGRVQELGNRYSTARYMSTPIIRLTPSMRVPWVVDQEIWVICPI